MRMRASIVVLTVLLVGGICAVPADASTIRLLDDRYTATTRVTATAWGDPATILDGVSDERVGSVFGPLGPATFDLTSELLASTDTRAFQPALAWVNLNQRDPTNPTMWEAAAIGGPPTSSSVSYSFDGTRFESFWRFVVEGDDASLYTGLEKNSSGDASLTLLDLTLGTTVAEHQVAKGDPYFTRWNTLIDGHQYALFTSLVLSGGMSDPDVRVRIGSNTAIQPVPEPATVVLVGTGLLMAYRRGRRQPKV